MWLLGSLFNTEVQDPEPLNTQEGEMSDLIRRYSSF